MTHVHVMHPMHKPPSRDRAHLMSHAGLTQTNVLHESCITEHICLAHASTTGCIKEPAPYNLHRISGKNKSMHLHSTYHHSRWLHNPCRIEVSKAESGYIKPAVWWSPKRSILGVAA